MSGIMGIINADKYVTYANDSYVKVTGSSLEETREKA